MATLLAMRSDSDITAQELEQAREKLALDRQIQLVDGGLAVGLFSVRVTPSPSVWADVEAKALSEEERAELRSDVRQSDYVTLTALDSARKELEFVAGSLAEELGASVYDPREDAWLSLDQRRLQALREDIAEHLSEDG